METKKRHGCVTAYLIFMIVANSLTALYYLLSGNDLGIPNNLLMLLIILSFANGFFAVLLFQWKILGFWGFIISSIGALIININLGLGIGQSLIGLVGIAVLFAVLQIEKDHISAWKNLE